MSEEKQQLGTSPLFRWRWWVLAFIFGVVVAAVTLFPARLLSPYITPQVQNVTKGKLLLESVSGTVWDTEWKMRLNGRESVVLHSELGILPLFIGKLRLAGSLRSDTISGVFEVVLSSSQVQMSGVRFNLKPELLLPLVSVPAQVEGDIGLRINELVIATDENAWPEQLSAELVWQGGNASMNGKSVSLPPLKVAPVLAGETITLEPIAEGVDGVLANVVMKQNRQMHVKVYQRGAALVNAGVGGAPDKIVFEVERPW